MHGDGGGAEVIGLPPKFAFGAHRHVDDEMFGIIGDERLSDVARRRVLAVGGEISNHRRHRDQPPGLHRHQFRVTGADADAIEGSGLYHGLCTRHWVMAMRGRKARRRPT